MLSLHAQTAEILLKLSKGLNWPVWNFSQPWTVLSMVEADNQQHITITMPLTPDQTSIRLYRTGKTSADTVIENNIIVRDQAIEIEKIWINGVLLELPTLQQCFEFYPEYQQSDQDYARQHSIELPICRYETRLFYNGCWQFEFDQPFFPWYNRRLMQGLKDVNHWAKAANLGIATDSQRRRLDRLLEQLSQ
jgi:hypothetical protein